MRTPYVGGNWKMNTTRASAATLARELTRSVARIGDACEVVIFPPFPYLLAAAASIGEASEGNHWPIKLGAQDCYHEASGAFTGEVSIAQLEDCEVSVILTGHSERRHVIGETDGLINQKTRAALQAGLECVLCIGETLDQRQAGETDAVNKRQLRAGLDGVSADEMRRVTIAYEPVWAIGTGKVATAEDAQTAHARCREVLAQMFDQPTAGSTRIMYGGSLKAANAPELLAQPDIDGGLVGGASLTPADFIPIVQAAAARAHRPA